MNELFAPPVHQSCVLRLEIVEGLERYFNQRIETGRFLRSVLENDLLGAVKRADPVSRVELPFLLDILLEHAPDEAWGSKEAVSKWLERDATAPPKQQRSLLVSAFDAKEKMLISAEFGWRDVWHLQCPATPTIDHSPMAHLPGRKNIEDGSVLRLYECAGCGARCYAGLNINRRVVVEPVEKPAEDTCTIVKNEAVAN